MTLLVFGSSGQVATELRRFMPDARYLSRAEVDLSDAQACAAALRAAAPSAMINTAAYTAVDHAEEEEALARMINGDARPAIAHACAELGMPFVHISIDYAFDGTGDVPWNPSDPVSPRNAYGRTKLGGEEGAHAILRTSWVVSSHGANFVKSMLRLSKSRDALSIVKDQVGGPTPAADIAAACLRIIEALIADSTKSGTYHFSGAPDTSWKGFAETIFGRAQRDRDWHPNFGLSDTGRASAQFKARLQFNGDCFWNFPPRLAGGIDRFLQELGVVS